MLKSFAVAMEAAFPELYSFVRSHRTARFDSTRAGALLRDETSGGSQEEDVQGMWASMLVRTRRGVERVLNMSHRGDQWQEVWINRRVADFSRPWSESQYDRLRDDFAKVLAHPPMFLNINDRFSFRKHEYGRQLKIYNTELRTLFGNSAYEGTPPTVFRGTGKACAAMDAARTQQQDQLQAELLRLAYSHHQDAAKKRKANQSLWQTPKYQVKEHDVSNRNRMQHHGGKVDRVVHTSRRRGW